ncbi:MAG: DMT family transporter [Clostridia bacterium]|nr:DMT family transporter [Clostridia bacterium]
MSFIKKSNAAYLLLLNAVLWGSSYVWSKMLLEYLPRFSILFLCSLGGLVSTLLIYYPQLRTISLKAIGRSAGISVFSIISNTFFILALQFTSSSNAAFIVQMSVVFTPFLMAAIEKKRPEGKSVLSILVAILGLFLLTCDLNNFCLKLGDLFALGNALFFSVFLTCQKVHSEKLNPVHFSMIHHAINTAGFLTLMLIVESTSIRNLKNINSQFLLLISMSILITILTILIQSAAIKFVRPEKAALIYTIEPVAALVLAGIFIGEKLEGPSAVIGCGLILLSVIYSLYTHERKKEIHKDLNNGAVLRGGKGFDEYGKI